MASRKQSHDDASLFLEYDVHIPTRTLYIGSVSMDEDGNEEGVNFRLSERVIKGLHLLDSIASETPINIILNNVGGEPEDGLAIYDAIKNCKNNTSITVFGKSWSMAGYILQSSNERLMHKHSSFLLHEGTLGFTEQHRRNTKRWMEFSIKQEKILFNILLERIKEKHPKFTAKKLEEMLMFDTILSPEETVELGLCDKVID